MAGLTTFIKLSIYSISSFCDIENINFYQYWKKKSSSFSFFVFMRLFVVVNISICLFVFKDPPRLANVIRNVSIQSSLFAIYLNKTEVINRNWTRRKGIVLWCIKHTIFFITSTMLPMCGEHQIEPNPA